MKIITIHGIRSKDKWYEKFKELSIWKKANIEITHFEYGFFSLGKFLYFRSRRKIIKRFVDYYSENFDPNEPPSLVCHSFGTYIFFSAIRKYTSIKFDKVILCGSILSPYLNWKPFFDTGQVRFLYNDYGTEDNVVKYSKYVISSCGNSGEIGFLNIPAILKQRIVQRRNYLDHSEYFLPIHMAENWGKILLPGKTYKFNKKILRPEIIDRIYKNIGAESDDRQQLAFPHISYNARIDERGNYFASYTKTAMNRGDENISTYLVHTTADSINSSDEMDFQAFSDENRRLSIGISDDSVQDKTFVIYLGKQVKQHTIFKVNYKFKWRETINFKTGDTDHFDIKNASEISIKLNFKNALGSSRFFVIKGNNIVAEHPVSHYSELDSTFSYNFEYKNTDDNDGLIFYFESITNIITSSVMKKNLGNLKYESSSISISRCSFADIKQVYGLELDVEHSNAASEVTLKERLSMFGDGFLVARYNNKIIGYIETVIWNDIDFSEFNEIKNFPLHYNVNGDTMYIIFLAVSNQFRRKGVGTLLLQSVEKVALRYNLKKMKLVAKDDLLTFYNKSNFNQVRELPNFLEGKDYKSMLMERYF